MKNYYDVLADSSDDDLDYNTISQNIPEHKTVQSSNWIGIPSKCLDETFNLLEFKVKSYMKNVKNNGFIYKDYNIDFPLLTSEKILRVKRIFNKIKKKSKVEMISFNCKDIKKNRTSILNNSIYNNRPKKNILKKKNKKKKIKKSKSKISNIDCTIDFKIIDFKILEKYLIKNGWKLVRQKNHKVFQKEIGKKQQTLCLPNTPSDVRAIKNKISQLKKIQFNK